MMALPKDREEAYTDYLESVRVAIARQSAGIEAEAWTRYRKVCGGLTDYPRSIYAYSPTLAASLR